MTRFIEGMDRQQSTLFPECLEDWICEDNPVRVIDAFVDELDLAELRFEGVDPEATGRPSYHPVGAAEATAGTPGAGSLGQLAGFFPENNRHKISVRGIPGRCPS